jgi:hypothetical protein
MLSKHESPITPFAHCRTGDSGVAVSGHAQCAKQAAPWTAEEKPIVEQLRRLRSLADDEPSIATKRLALHIRQLPARPSKVGLAENLAHPGTEGDPGHGALQEVAATLAQAIAEQAAAGAPRAARSCS